MMQVNNNIQLDQSAYLNANQALNRISSGVKVDSAASDAASLSISANLNLQQSGISQSLDNTNSAIASIQIGDSALSEQSNILDKVKEKLLEASTDTTSQEGRNALLKEIKDLLKNFDDIASSTNYAGQTLLQNNREDQSASDALEFQSGENPENRLGVSSIQSNTIGAGLEDLLNQAEGAFTSTQARSYLESVDNAISTLNDFRSELGSSQNQLQSSANNLLAQESLTATATSTIRDIDYSQEVSNFSKQNILAQIGAYGAAQSNNINQSIVSRLLS